MKRGLIFAISILAAVVPASAQHRYWRVYVNTNTGGVVACAELELHATTGGSNIATGGTAEASSDNGNPAANCFDGNPSTYWASLTGPPQWIGYDLGSGHQNNVVEIKWTPLTSSSSYSPTNLLVQFSDDNATWFSAWSLASIGGWSPGVPQSLTEPNQGTTGVSVSKANGYAALLSIDPGVSISKALGYAILRTGPPAAVLSVHSGSWKNW